MPEYVWTVQELDYASTQVESVWSDLASAVANVCAKPTRGSAWVVEPDNFGGATIHNRNDYLGVTYAVDRHELDKP